MDIENFPASPGALRMMDTVTKGFYDKSYVAKWLFQVMGIEIDGLRELMKEIPEQIFPETATWGLMYHEQKWQIPVRENLSYEERRILICQKRDFRAPMTPFRMEKYLADAPGFKVCIADASDPGEYGFIPSHPNLFKVYFSGEGTLDLKQIYDMVNRLKQSHTAYIIGDRLEAESDNRNLNHIIFERIHFVMSVPFWYVYERTLDGSWLLDGSVLLHTRKAYQLILGIKFIMDKAYTQLYQNASFGVEINNRTKETIKIKPVYYTGFYSDTTETAALKTHMAVLGNSEDVNITVETKNRSRWFLDGTVPLDGSKRLDSIYIKEEIP